LLHLDQAIALAREDAAGYVDGLEQLKRIGEERPARVRKGGHYCSPPE
jgi:hypothetical protein